jgi:hypothetical protein
MRSFGAGRSVWFRPRRLAKRRGRIVRVSAAQRRQKRQCGHSLLKRQSSLRAEARVPAQRGPLVPSWLPVEADQGQLERGDGIPQDAQVGGRAVRSGLAGLGAGLLPCAGANKLAKFRRSVDSETLRNEIEALEGRLPVLRAEVAEATESSAELEHRLNEAQGRHDLVSRALSDHVELLVAKRQELRELEREEAVRRRDEAVERLAAAVEQLLLAIEAHDAAVKDLSDHDPGREPKPADGRLDEAWNRLKDAVRERADADFADERVEAAIRSRTPNAINALPADLRAVARERIQARPPARSGQSRGSGSR